jgi:hypothetical protein
VRVLIDEAGFYDRVREELQLDPDTFEPKELRQPDPSLPAATTKIKLRVAGLFAGVGGVEEGFRQAGHE